MTGEASGTTGHRFYWDTEHVVSNDGVAADIDVNDVCVQTGEEFSTEFLRDRDALRRAQIMTEVHHHQPRRVQYNYNQNPQMVYEDINGILGMRRMDSECNSDTSEFVYRKGYAVGEVEKSAYPDNGEKLGWKYGDNGQKSGKFAVEANSDQVKLESNPYTNYLEESNKLCHHYGGRVLKGSFSSKMKFLCSFGGRILPRPCDGKLRYVGGDTRILSIGENLTWLELVKKTSAICNQPHTIKYQLPGEDLDALISVCSDEDFHHMREEYQELERIGGSQRLRLFLVSLNDPESPTSFEGRAPHRTDSDYQYLLGVKAMIDPSPQRNSSGQNLASQTSPFRNTSDYSPTFHKDYSPTAYTLKNKDYSPTSSNLVGMFSNPAAQFLSNPKMQCPSFNQSPPISPITSRQIDNRSSNSQFCVDRQCTDGNKTINRFYVDKLPCENSYYADGCDYVNNLPHGPQSTMNYHHHSQYLEHDQTKKTSEVHFHNRRPSEICVPYQRHGQSDMNQGRHLLKERSLSDSKLQEHAERSKCYLERDIPLSTWNYDEIEKSPSLAMTNSTLESLRLCQEMFDEKHQVPDYERQHISKTPGFEINQEKITDIKNACSAQDREDYERNPEITLSHTTMGHKDIQNVKYLPSACLSPRNLQNSGAMGSISPSIPFKESADSMGKHYQSGIISTEFFLNNHNVTKDQNCSMTETANGQTASHTHPQVIMVQSPGSDDQELIIHGSKSTASASSSREVSLHDENPMNYALHIVEKDSTYGKSSDGQKLQDAFCLQPQLSDNLCDNKLLESGVIGKNVNGSTHPGIPLSSRVVSDTKTDGIARESDYVDTKDDGKDKDESISDAALAEMEAGIYGLQIIKNSDLEELQELGSGTFGTVYHGKWRGTDVAIKIINKSCFSGGLSEQERLDKEFWREAQILSKLHHPNVVAFYGVVPDGPEGTMATVTEFMVNGSLRRILPKKYMILDRRKRLMIILDAAFGMEYLHLKNIVHFDLKCDNLLVNLRDPQRPICKVGDFGLSKIKRNTCISGGVRGTLPWMAPELLDGGSNQVSEKVDVYSFGIAMWEVLTGEEPYANMHCGTIIGGILSDTLRPPIPDNCDPEWRNLMEKCWSFSPAARPSFTEITNRLRHMSNLLPPKRRNPANR